MVFDMKKEALLYTVIVLSIVFIPAAYVLLAAVFVVRAFGGNIRYCKEMVLPAIFSLLGVIFSTDIKVSLVYAAMIMASACGYCFASDAKADNERFLRVVYGAAAVVFIIGIIQFASPQFTMPSKWVDRSEYDIDKRAFATFFNPNSFGFFINVVIISLCSRANRTKLDNFETITFVAGLVCLCLTFSRSAWLSLIASLLVAGVFLDRKYVKWMAVIAFSVLITNMVLSTGRLSPLKAVNDSSLKYRFEIWRTCAAMIKDYPLTGVGLGAFFKNVPLYSHVVSPKVEHCHNLYLQVVTETGILGSVCAVVGLCALAVFIKSSICRDGKGGIAGAATVVVIMALVHSLMDSVLFTPQIMLVMSLWAGHALGSKSRFNGLQINN